jgi:hypothetical protein
MGDSSEFYLLKEFDFTLHPGEAEFILNGFLYLCLLAEYSMFVVFIIFYKLNYAKYFNLGIMDF